MILPQTYSQVWILMALSLICWGSWANTYKLGKYKFEVYYLDFAIGCLAISLIYSLTVGNLGFDGFSFLDDLEHTGKRQWLYAFTAGVIFNLGNMLLTGAISVGGMAVGFLTGIGMAIMLSSLLTFVTKPAGNLMMTLWGCALIVGAIVVLAFAINVLGEIRHEGLARGGRAKSMRRPTTLKPVILALVAGLLIGSYSPLMDKATDGDVGLGPYAVMAVFSIAIFLSTLVFEVFFMNLPVEGDPMEFTAYFRANPKQHLWGLLGGALWCTGAVAALAAGYTPSKTAHLAPAANAAMSLGYPLLAVLWGLLVWKEFREGDIRVKASTLVMLVLFAGGLTLISMAPLYLRRG